MRWDPRAVDYLASLERERARLISGGCTEYLARRILAEERIATMLEELWMSEEEKI
jgi:hypothetical protein